MTGPTRLRRYLKKHRESRRAFARRAGIHYSRISRFLSDASTPGRESALAIEAATGGAVPVESWSATVRRAPRRASQNPAHRSE